MDGDLLFHNLPVFWNKVSNVSKFNFIKEVSRTETKTSCTAPEAMRVKIFSTKSEV